jgi:DNA polymerase-3 subunit alpha (Gram-positive type)
MHLRGYSIRQVDIEKSAAHDFVISEDKKSLYLPFSAVDALGAAAAESVVDARNERPFTSKKDVEKRTKLNKTTFNKLLRLGVLDSLNDEENNSLL